MKKKRKFWQVDYILFFTILALVCFGVLFLSTVSSHFSLEIAETTTYFLFHQIKNGLLPGLFLGVILFFLPLKLIRKITPALAILNLILVFLVFVPQLGLKHGGASRWLNIAGVSFQPSEFLKLTVILYFSSWIKTRFDEKKKKSLFGRKKIIYDLKYFLLPFAFLIGVLSLIFIRQPDISTLGVIVSISFILYFSAGTPIWHNIILALIGLGGLISLIIQTPYRFSRLLLFLRPEIDPLGKGFQIKQALISIGSGGILGKGIGYSSQKFGFLPHPMSDTIFAVFAEEAGFVGSLILLSLFLVLFWRGLRISKSTDNKFLKLTSLGIICWILIQAFVNIGAQIGILPLTGIPLPFISYGGSHLVAELAAMGILLNISRNV